MDLPIDQLRHFLYALGAAALILLALSITLTALLTMRK